MTPISPPPKIKWILDNIEGVRGKSRKRKNYVSGTVDSWLVWKFTHGRVHVTDVSNASRTMLFNIHTQKWDKELLDLFNIPESMLPEVKSSSEIYSETATTLFSTKIPIAGIAGRPTSRPIRPTLYRTGHDENHLWDRMLHGDEHRNEVITSENNLLSTIAWKIGNTMTYALEGSVSVGGAAIQWLRDGISLIQNAAQSEALATSVPDNGGVYFVPALTGMGAPLLGPVRPWSYVGSHGRNNSRTYCGPPLEGIAFQVYDISESHGTRYRNVSLRKCE